MKLTVEQIEKLFSFTRQHYVEYYDLQLELVDHLANAIENKWQENPKLSFDEILNLEFKKFGVFGFMEVVEKRQNYLTKKYNLLIWEHFKTFFGIPKIITTLFLVFIFYYVLKLSSLNYYIFFGLVLCLIIWSFYEMIKNSIKLKRKEKNMNKKWLFDEIINKYGHFSGVIFFPLQIIINVSSHFQNNLKNDYCILGFSFVFVVYAIINYIIFKIIPLKANEYLNLIYPEFKLENL